MRDAENDGGACVEYFPPRFARARTLGADELELDLAAGRVHVEELADGAHGLAVELRVVHMLRGDAHGRSHRGSARETKRRARSAWERALEDSREARESKAARTSA